MNSCVWLAEPWATFEFYLGPPAKFNGFTDHWVSNLHICKSYLTICQRSPRGVGIKRNTQCLSHIDKDCMCSILCSVQTLQQSIIMNSTSLIIYVFAVLKTYTLITVSHQLKRPPIISYYLDPSFTKTTCLLCCCLRQGGYLGGLHKNNWTDSSLWWTGNRAYPAFVQLTLQ